MITVAALYIDPRGPYPKMEGVDCWDETRDARKYDGPHPVVAHPPCGPWGKLRHMSRRPQDADLFRYALASVREFGGVLEHPEHSLAFDAFNMPKPGEFPDAFGGFTVHVNQCDWGHPARKSTWLYMVCVSGRAIETMPRREPTHWISGGRGREGKKAKTTPVPPGIKVCSAQQRRRTPPLFAEYLVRLARSAASPSKGTDR